MSTGGQSQSGKGVRRWKEKTDTQIMLNITEKITNHEEEVLGLPVPADDCGVFPDIERMKVNKYHKSKLTTK